MSESTINCVKELGSKLIKEVQIVINTNPPITQTLKICLNCNEKFIYERNDEDEKFFRQFASLKKGNLDLCFNCDELDGKLFGAKSFGKI